jgi:hypothetical protein
MPAAAAILKVTHSIAIFSFAFKKVRIWHLCSCKEPKRQNRNSPTANCEYKMFSLTTHFLKVIKTKLYVES